MPDTSKYFIMEMECPFCLAEGGSITEKKKWTHTGCGGELQVGDNAHLKCIKCNVDEHVARWDLQNCIFESKLYKEKPIDENPAEQKPVEENPAEQKPVEENPAEQKPVEENPAEQKPVEEKPSEQNKAVSRLVYITIGGIISSKAGTGWLKRYLANL